MDVFFGVFSIPVMILGIITMLKPLPALKISTRKRALGVFFAGFAVFLLAGAVTRYTNSHEASKKLELESRSQAEEIVFQQPQKEALPTPQYGPPILKFAGAGCFDEKIAGELNDILRAGDLDAYKRAGVHYVMRGKCAPLKRGQEGDVLEIATFSGLAHFMTQGDHRTYWVPLDMIGFKTLKKEKPKQRQIKAGAAVSLSKTGEACLEFPDILYLISTFRAGKFSDYDQKMSEQLSLWRCVWLKKGQTGILKSEVTADGFMQFQPEDDNRVYWLDSATIGLRGVMIGLESTVVQ